jgi:hypothetical protein
MTRKSDRLDARDRLIQILLPQLTRQPSEQQSIRGLAEACGTTVWAMRRTFGHVEAVYRIALTCLGRRIVATGAHAPAPRSSVLATLEAFARFYGALVETEDYRALVQILVRNGHRYGWLEEDYERRVAAPLCGRLAEAIEEAGLQLGGGVVLGGEDARLMLDRMVQALVLPTLLPGWTAPAAGERERLLREIAHKAFEATVFVPWGGPRPISRAGRTPAYGSSGAPAPHGFA